MELSYDSNLIILGSLLLGSVDPVGLQPMTSPPSWHPKQCQKPFAGVTWNEGLFSSWKGHRPLSEPPPALFSAVAEVLAYLVRIRQLML